MKTKQTGFFTPLFVAVMLVITAAFIPLPPSAEVAVLKKLRYQHSVWWFWQQATIEYRRKYDSWPLSIEELASTFQLNAAPDYISGFTDLDKFRVRWSNLNDHEMALLNSGLAHAKVEFHVTGIDAVLQVQSEPEGIDGVHRRQTETMDSNILMNSFEISQARDVYVTQASMAEPGAPFEIRALSASMQWLSIDAVVMVNKIASDPLRTDELGILLQDINMLYSKLEAHMLSTR